MNTAIYTIDEIQKRVNPVAAKHGISKVYLFGSYARGSADNQSDVDLCIDADNIKGLFALGRVYADFEDALGKSLDLVTVKSLLHNNDKDFVNNLEKDRILIYEYAN